MIKAKLGTKDGDVVLLGLSHANLDKLRADGLKGFIRIDGKELGIGHDIWITAAASEAVILDAFVRHDIIGPDTKLNIDKRVKQ